MIDSVPLYHQIKNKIHEAILNREYKPGERLPGEPELMEFFGVSRITIRKAMTELENEGLLIKKQGKGTFVSDIIVSSTLDEINGYSQCLQRMGYAPGRRVIFIKYITQFDDLLAEKLQVKPGEGLIHLKRLFLADGEAFTLEDAFYPEKLKFFLDEDLNTTSTYALMKERAGLIPYKSEKIIGINTASEEVAGYLGIEPGHPILLTNELVFDPNDVPIHYSVCYSLGERVRVRMVACASVGVNVSSYEFREKY